jgi:hypothetical protein
MSHAQLDQEARRRIARAVAGGETLRDPAEARAAVLLARSAERRLRARTVPSAVLVSAGTTVVWLLLVALPATIGSGVHVIALLAGLGVGALLFAAILLLGQRQIRLVKRSERGNQRLLESARDRGAAPPPPFPLGRRPLDPQPLDPQPPERRDPPA